LQVTGLPATGTSPDLPESARRGRAPPTGNRS